MTDRNSFRDILINKDELYLTHRESRGLNLIRHYGKLHFNSILSEEMKDLTIIDKVWKESDRLNKLSYQYYGESKYWWVIALFNQKPADFLFKPGDIVHIPLPLDEVIYLYTREH